VGAALSLLGGPVAREARCEDRAPVVAARKGAERERLESSGRVWEREHLGFDRGAGLAADGAAGDSVPGPRRVRSTRGIELTAEDARRPAGAWGARDVVGGTMLGIAGGGLGLVAGAYLGAAFEVAVRDERENCFICLPVVGLAVGGLVGEAVGLGLGVHAGAGGCGTAGDHIVSALGIGGLGVMAAVATGEGVVLVAIPVAQIVNALEIERKARATAATAVPSR
jgi:hypothetical protein